MKVVIVGGVAGGASAAARLRRLDEQAEIIMFERGAHISFANCGIPYLVGDVIKEQEKLLLMTPHKFKALLNVEARIHSEVIAIDRVARKVTVRDLRADREYTESYDKLVLSPGAAPVKPRIPGIDNERIFTVRTVEDGVKIKAIAKPGMKAAVIGGGFIGLEMAENLHHLGLEVSIIEMSNQVMGPIDYEMAAKVHNHIRSKDVALYLSDGVTAFERGERVGIQLQSGKQLDADLVIFAIGVRPETALAEKAGLALGSTRGILVDKHLLTSDPDIYALGDAVEIRDAISGSAALVPLAGPANRQGRIVAENITGQKSSYDSTQGTAIAKVFDLTVAATGNSEKQLRAKGIDYQKTYSLAWSHAEYYPNPFQLTIKLLFSPEDGKVLGAQVVGMEGVDKRIDTLATAIAFGATTAQLAQLELAYAPPYGSAKDPVNLVGMIAENIRAQRMGVIHWDELNINDENQLLLDVRTATEYKLNSLPGALNIPYEELRGRLNELPRDRKIVLFCTKGQKAYFASRILMQNNFDNTVNLVGGLAVLNPVLADRAAAKMPAAAKAQTLRPVCCAPQTSTISLEIDACGLQCPGPILKVAQALEAVASGGMISVKTTDPGFKSDIGAWCRSTGNVLVQLREEKGILSASIQKGSGSCQPDGNSTRSDGKTLVVFSNDLDKAIASFIIANGAAATGKPVTMFFTFWGLSVLRRSPAPAVGKDFISRMFGMMLPKGVNSLRLSKMHMGGMGTAMMKYVMRSKNVASLPQLIEQAKAQGVRLIACQMSLDVMGLKAEELIDGVEIGGVASYIERAEQADLNLFI